MKTTNKTTGMKNRKVILSTLWIFATLNYLYCDVVGLMNPDMLRQYLTGSVNGIHMTQGFLLGAGILVEIPMAMVLLSRALGYSANRWANVVAGSIMTAGQFSTLVFTRHWLTTSSSAFLKLGVLRLLSGMHGRGLTLKVECELVQIQGY